SELARWTESEHERIASGRYDGRSARSSWEDEISAIDLVITRLLVQHRLHTAPAAHRNRSAASPTNSRIAGNSRRAWDSPIRWAAARRERSRVLFSTGTRSGTNTCALPAASRAKMRPRVASYFV